MEKNIDKSVESLKTISEYIGENYFFSKDGIRNLKNNIKNVLLELEKKKEHNKILIKEVAKRDKKIEEKDNEISRLDKELMIKDKMVDLILSRWKQDDVRSIETLKYFFEREVLDKYVR